MTPGKRASPPVAFVPAIRPCLLACVPSWMFTGRVEQAVPALGAVAGGEDAVVAGAALVVVDAQRARCRPTSRPAACASATAGRAPVPTTTWSAG